MKKLLATVAVATSAMLMSASASAEPYPGGLPLEFAESRGPGPGSCEYRCYRPRTGGPADMGAIHDARQAAYEGAWMPRSHRRDRGDRIRELLIGDEERILLAE